MTSKSTPSMEARAAQLVSESFRWTRGSRKSDGLAFVLFPSSKPGHAHYTRVDGGVCNCPGYLYRGICAHAIAVRADYEQARAETREPMANLYQRCARVGCEQVTEGSLLCDECSALAERSDRMAAARARIIERFL